MVRKEITLANPRPSQTTGLSREEVSGSGAVSRVLHVPSTPVILGCAEPQGDMGQADWQPTSVTLPWGKDTGGSLLHVVASV